MAGRLCIYVRDTQHTADLYDSTAHSFAVSIHEVGSNSPLIWKGTNYKSVWLPFVGESGRIAGEFEIPAGTYLVKGYAQCQNVVTHVAWVQVNDGETASVNLIPTGVQFCLMAAQLGVALGTVKLEGKDTPVAKVAPAEVAAFGKAVTALAEKLPKEAGLTLLSAEELRKLFQEVPK